LPGLYNNLGSATGCAHNKTNQNVQNKFGKLGETVSRKFGEVLESL